MKLSAFLLARLTRLQLPAALLVALLQRTPVLRIFAGASDYVVTSPVGQLLRGGFTAAVLGAMHSRAGATTFLARQGNVDVVRFGNDGGPMVNQSIVGTVGAQITPVTFTYLGTPTSPTFFQIVGGSLPSGLNFIPAVQAGGIIRSSTPAISGVPTAAGSFLISVKGFDDAGYGSDFPVELSFQIGGIVPNAPPSITAQPQSQTVSAGGSVTFSVAATGQPPPTYQWRKNNANILGATGASLSLANVTSGDAGTYSVVITNSSGSIASASVTLSVNPSGSPAFIIQPVSQTIATGHTVVFNSAATGASSFQWQRNGVNIAGGTGPTLVVNNAGAASAGVYTVVASGAGGAAAASLPATLAVIDEPNFGRLINLSILTSISASGDFFTMGYVVGGAGTTGSKPLVIRAAGPALAALGVPGTLNDPKLELFAGSTKSGENDNWGGSAQLAAALTSVGAFPFSVPASLDAAMLASISTRDNSVKVSAANTGIGTVIAEIYDATPAGTFGAGTPRLLNVSVLKPIGSKLTMGFVVGGLTAKTVLVRAVAPTLSSLFGISGVVADPQLTLFGAGAAQLAQNNDWGGGSALANAFTSVGAFLLPSGSADAAVLVTLAPGDYTVEVTGVANTTGIALVEVYEVP